MKYEILVAAAIGVLAGAGIALAADTTVSQKGKAFSVKEVTLKKGESLTFTNDDNITHNALSRSPGNEFNIGAQTPGASTSVKFDTAGTVDVICAIHPQMRMKVTVTD
jgi:plastocyanin